MGLSFCRNETQESLKFPKNCMVNEGRCWVDAEVKTWLFYKAIRVIILNNNLQTSREMLIYLISKVLNMKYVKVARNDWC